MAEPALIERVENGTRRPPQPVEPPALELGPAQEPPAELTPERQPAEPPPAPEAGLAPAARATTAMQARFGNARTARLMSESALAEGRAGTEAQAPAVPAVTMPAPQTPAPAAAPEQPVVAAPAMTAGAPTAAAPLAATPIAEAPIAAAPPAATPIAAAPATARAAPAEAPAVPAEAVPPGAAPAAEEAAEPAAPSLEAPPGTAPPGAPPPGAAAAAGAPPPGGVPPTAAAAAPAAAPGAPGVVPGEAAAPAPTPALDTSSTEGMIASLGSFSPSALGPALAQASTALPGLQEKEKADLGKSLPEIDRPTGLPPRPAPPEGESTDLAAGAPVEGESPEARKGEPPPVGGEVATGPVPGEEVSTIAPEPPAEDEDGGDSWWSSIWGRIQSFLKSLPSTDSGVSTSAGPRPSVDMSGDADPSQNRKHKGESDVQVQDAKTKGDAASRADFGENEIAPVVPAGQRLRPSYQPGAPEGGKPAGRETPPVDPEVRAAFDQQAAPKMAETVAEQRSQEALDREEYRQKSAEVRAEGERRIAEETESSRTEQEGLRQSARADVQAERERWREEDEKAGKEYSEKSEEQRRETDKQVDEKAKTAEKQADEKLGQAERDAEAKKRETEAQAAAKKREAESRPRSWWDRVKGAVSAAFSALKKAVTGLFNVLRAAVKKLINAAKAIVRGLIEAARLAIVGLIKAYGLALKGLVSIALFAFPETAREARAFIDARVNDTVDAVNSAAEALKNACDKILDWVAEGLDFALGLLQKAVLFYIEIYEKLVMLLLDVLERIGNLVSSAKQMPDHFLGQMSEELLGMNLTEPLPIERSAAPDATKTAKTALEAGQIESGDLRAVTQRSVTPDQVQLDAPPLVEDLHPDLLKQFGATEGREVEFGEREGPEFGLSALQQAAMGAPPPAAGPAATNQPATAGGGRAETQEERAERELQELMARPMPDTCGGETKQEPAGPSQVPEEMKIGPLSAGQRGRYLLDQMVKGIKKWFACNWPKLLAGAVAAILGVILLNVLTGGAILAALPLLMKVVALVMLGAALVRITAYVGDYLSMAWDGNLVAGAKALARGLAIGAVELVFALLFNLGAVIKALKGGLKGAAKVAATAAKETIVGGLKAARDLGKLGIQAAKTAVKNGKLIVSGLRAGAVRGARSIKDFTMRLWKNLRFRKFKIVFSRGWFRLLGWINPWIVVMEGEMKGQLKKIDKSELAGRKVSREAQASTFKTVDNQTVMGKLLSESDDLPTNYRHNAEIFFGKAIDDSVVHHMIEQQTRNLTTAVNDILLHAPANLKLIPKGEINSVVHLSRIRIMWNQLYTGIKVAGVPEKGVLASLRHFERYTDEFIEHMLAFAKKAKSEGTGLTKAALQKEADDWLELLATKVKEAEEIGKQALQVPAAGAKVVQ